MTLGLLDNLRNNRQKRAVIIDTSLRTNDNNIVRL